MLAGLKHLNRLEQVLARGEWDDPDIAEGLMLDADANVIEGTVTNVFMVRNSSLITPEVNRAGVAGVMRGLILDLAGRSDIPCTVRDIRLQELAAADEVFVCNSLIQLWAVKSIGDWAFAPGPVTRRIAELVAQAEGVNTPG